MIGTLQTFPIVYLMTDGGPDHASEVFGTYIFKEGFVIGDTGYSSALSTLVLIPRPRPVGAANRQHLVPDWVHPPKSPLHEPSIHRDMAAKATIWFLGQNHSTVTLGFGCPRNLYGQRFASVARQIVRSKSSRLPSPLTTSSPSSSENPLPIFLEQPDHHLGTVVAGTARPPLTPMRLPS